jgi:hypothetical protein
MMGPDRQGKGWKMSCLSAFIASSLLGCLVLVSIYTNFPVAISGDMNRDGISDEFQVITPIEDLVMKNGSWEPVVVGYDSEPDLLFLVFSGSLLVLVLPLSIALWIWNRPVRARKLNRWEEEGVMQDTVRRLAAFLEINPSLPEAVRLARSSMDEKDQRLLGPLVWGPFAEGRSFKQVYSGMVEEWRSRSPELGRALEGLSSAEREGSRIEVSSSSREVVQRLSEDTKSRMEEYSRSLSGPSTALFGLGVLLPMLLSTMIPVAGMSGRTAILVGFLLWVVLPAGMVYAGNTLLLRRPAPSFSKGAHGHSVIMPTPFNTASLVLGSIFLGISILSTASQGGHGGALYNIMDHGIVPLLLSFIGISMIVAGIIDMLTRKREAGIGEWKRTMEFSPHFLQEIAVSLSEGYSFERSLAAAIQKRNFLDKRGSFLPGEDRLLSWVPEPLRSFLGNAREYSKAGAGPGGQAVRVLSKHISGLVRLEKDMASRVRSTIGQMELTASLFAPLMIGTSAGIFSLMETTSGTIPDGLIIGGGVGEGSIGVFHFVLLTGGYLLSLSIVSTLVLHRLETGDPHGGWGKVPRRILQSSLAFAAGVIISTILIG